MASKRQRNYQKEYTARTAKAKREGFKEYGQKRRVLAKTKAKVLEQQKVLEGIVGDYITVPDLTPQQEKALELLTAWDVDKSEIERLRQAGADFWKEARPILERESELARGIG